MKPSLSLSYGLMYQWHGPPVDKEGRQTVLVLKDTGELVNPQNYLAQKRAAAEQGDIFNPDIAYLPVKEAGRDGVFDVNRKTSHRECPSLGSLHSKMGGWGAASGSGAR